MRRFCIAWVSGWILLAGLAPSSSAGTRALLIGIDHYDNPGPPVGTNPVRRTAWSNLDGAVNDVLAIQSLLHARFGVPADRILVLTNGAAGREAILDAYRRHLIDPAGPGDQLLFYYSGHGSQVPNSKSSEPDRMDETLVPSDANRGAADIRDKELRRLHNAALDRGAALTIVMDSCHSGSAARGLAREGATRSLPAAEGDVADDEDPGPAPESRGALVFSAAQDFQLAREDMEEVDGVVLRHGAFSLALSRTLRVAPLHAPADEIFHRTRALMKARGWAQEPVLAGDRERRRQPFLGGAASSESAMRIAVMRADPNGDLTLLAGRATGLGPGSELVAVGTNPPVRLQVKSLSGIDRSIARVVEGAAESVKPGDLFELSRWSPPAEAALRLHVATGMSARALQAQRNVAEDAMRRTTWIWVKDPTAQPPDATLRWMGTNWVAWREGRRIEFGARWEEADLAALARGLSEPRLFVEWPLPAESSVPLRAQVESMGIAISGPEHATYRLVGRATDQRLEYAWVRPEALAEDEAALPARAEWVAAPDDGEQIHASLVEQAGRLARIAGWLLVPTPPDDGVFPYRLALQPVEPGELRRGGTYREGDAFDLVLELDRAYARTPIQQRYVYVFCIDSLGRSTLVYPDLHTGSVENRIPWDKKDIARVVPLRDARISVAPPFGLDSFVLLTTVEPLPDPSVLEFDGVRTRGGEVADPLAALLGNWAGGARGARVTAPPPATWGIDRITMRAVPAALEPEKGEGEP